MEVSTNFIEKDELRIRQRDRDKAIKWKIKQKVKKYLEIIERVTIEDKIDKKELIKILIEDKFKNEENVKILKSIKEWEKIV